MDQRRQQAKERVRGQILRAGLTLFDRVGFDRATVADVAAAAGVSPITVYRHFGTKDALVLPSRHEGVDLLRAIAAGTMPDPDPRRCVVEAVTAFARSPREDELWRLRSRIIARSPQLQHIDLARRVELERALTEVLSQRPDPGPGLGTEVACAAGLAALHQAVRRWRDGTAKDLGALVTTALTGLWPDVATDGTRSRG